MRMNVVLPNEVVTVNFFSPAVEAPKVAVSELSVFAETVTCVDPCVTVAPVRLLPEITAVPPRVDTTIGETLETEGAGS